MKKYGKTAAGVMITALVGAAVIGTAVFARGRAGGSGQMPQGQFEERQPGQFEERQPGQGGVLQSSPAQSADSPSEIVTSDVENSAAALTANRESAETITMSDADSEVKIDEAGTYIVTGSCSDGSITVKKETAGVVLILKDLDLTSSRGAALSLNRNSEVMVMIEGTVRLTDAENPEDEYSGDAETADAYDGAAIKVKAGADVVIAGTGNLIIDASSVKNGIKTSGDEAAKLILDGPSVEITAANDGINAGYDLTILSGSVTVNAGDDGIHADRVLTIGSGDGSGPVIDIEKSGEGLEATVVNICGGEIEVSAEDDGINAADSEEAYISEMAFSVNIMGGTVTVVSRGDGIDSNGNVNLIGGTVSISSASNGGEAGIDYDGSYYCSPEVVLNNTGGMSGADGMMGRPGMNGQIPEMNGGMPQGQEGRPGMNGQMPEMNGGMNGGRFPSGRGMEGEMPQPGTDN